MGGVSPKGRSQAHFGGAGGVERRRLTAHSAVAEAVAPHINHDPAGVNLPSVWDQLPRQLYLGDAQFAEVLGKKIGVRPSTDTEIPRLQSRASAPPLAQFAAMPARKPAIVQAYAIMTYPDSVRTLR